MAKYIPLSRQALQGRSWKRTTDLLFAATEQAVPIVAQELAAIAPEIPIGLIKDRETFRLVAILSLRPNNNLYVSPTGEWLVQHTPLFLRAHPFRLARDETSGKTSVCIDETNIMDNLHGEQFFEGDQPSKLVQQAIKLLELIERGNQAVSAGVAALVEADVIIPWDNRSSDQTVPTAGLYRINEVALNKLSDVEFLKLRKVGAIPIAYAQMMSMQQTHLLTRLAQLQEQQRAAPRTHVSKKEIDEMFKLDDGLIQF